MRALLCLLLALGLDEYTASAQTASPHNVRSLIDRWQRDSNQLLVKLQYAWRL